MLLNWWVNNETKWLLVHYENKMTRLSIKLVHIPEKELFQQVVVTESQQVEGCVK